MPPQQLLDDVLPEVVPLLGGVVWEVQGHIHRPMGHPGEGLQLHDEAHVQLEHLHKVEQALLKSNKQRCSSHLEAVMQAMGSQNDAQGPIRLQKKARSNTRTCVATQQVKRAVADWHVGVTHMWQMQPATECQSACSLATMPDQLMLLGKRD